MIAQVFENGTHAKLGEIEMAPRCGEDFCDSCGDCLSCFGDGCEDGCWWVVYADSMDDAVKQLDEDGSFGAEIVSGTTNLK